MGEVPEGQSRMRAIEESRREGLTESQVLGPSINQHIV